MHDTTLRSFLCFNDCFLSLISYRSHLAAQLVQGNTQPNFPADSVIIRSAAALPSSSSVQPHTHPQTEKVKEVVIDRKSDLSNIDRSIYRLQR